MTVDQRVRSLEFPRSPAGVGLVRAFGAHCSGRWWEVWRWLRCSLRRAAQAPAVRLHAEIEQPLVRLSRGAEALRVPAYAHVPRVAFALVGVAVSVRLRRARLHPHRSRRACTEQQQSREPSHGRTLTPAGAEWPRSRAFTERPA